jgi:hypothetical protein
MQAAASIPFICQRNSHHFFGCRIYATATGQKALHLGRNPTGYVMFTPEGRATFVFTAEGRRPAKTVEERAGLLNTVVAYTGAYRLEGDKWITKVEVAWNPDGLVPNRHVDDNLLHVLTP